MLLCKMCLGLLPKHHSIDMYLQVSGLAVRLKQADKDAALYNSREVLFGKPATDYSEVKKLWEAFEPFQQFWSVAAAWQVIGLTELVAAVQVRSLLVLTV